MRAPEFWAGHDHMARLAIAALTPIGWAYGATVAYKAAHVKPYRSTAKVICVGNLTSGGTGKTPVAVAIARRLVNNGCKTFILTRGYGGRMHGPTLVDPQTHTASQVGDESLLLATAAPTIVSRDRAAGAKVAEAHSADVIVMDDGHQNFSLAKDLSLLVVDAEQGFGNGRMLPAGPLREPVSRGLQRADTVVLMGEGELDLMAERPVVHARLLPLDAEKFRGRRVIAFAGIGRPEKFFQTLKQIGAEIVSRRPFADHHIYSSAELARLRDEARKSGSVLITTEKDYVRLTPKQSEGIHYLQVQAEFKDFNFLDRLVHNLARAGAEPIPA